MSIKIQDLLRMPQSELDALYKKSPVGDIPDGEAKGTALFVFGVMVGRAFASAIQRFAWQGKIFDRDRATLLNRITPARIKALKAQVYKAKGTLSDGEAIVVDYSKTSIFARATDELREVAPGLYLGNALWGKKRLTIFALEFREGVGGEMVKRGYQTAWPWRAYNWVAQVLDQKIGWHRLPTPLGLAVLVGVRNILREQNLHDTTRLPSVGSTPLPPWQSSFRTARTADGTYNDLDRPEMGRAGSRFGRNVPLESTYPEPPPGLMSPNPRTVSRELMTRYEFQPATTLNALVAAWLQFMVRDWMSHGRGSADDLWEVTLAESDPWPERPMKVPRTLADPTRSSDSSQPPTYVNTETHWWDGSQIYGSDAKAQQRIRTGSDGKLHIGPDGRLILPEDPQLNPALVPGWWLGLSLMSSLFVLEHNAICDVLKREYPWWSDEEFFQRARLINVAVLAKIHTVEWTPAVIRHPTTRIAMNANWFGLVGERVTNTFGRLSSNEVGSGIPGSETQHYDVPYCLTEEFVAVYRMHPLITDDWTFRSAGDDAPLEERPFREITGPHAQEIQERISLTDLLYSFGRTHPGALRLHNYPRDLQHFERPDGKLLDLAAVDILRSRELGVPRYNELRRQLHLPPAKSFEALTDNAQWADELRRVYGDDIERVDLTVGMFAEPLPKGFAFSDTAFRVFILMASRRLNSDRFFTRDYTPQVYTPLGMQWIKETDMSTVLLRHFPELRPALGGLTNAFVPWNAASA